MRQLLKHTPGNDPCIGRIQAAVTEMEQTVEQLNRSVAQAELSLPHLAPAPTPAHGSSSAHTATGGKRANPPSTLKSRR